MARQKLGRVEAGAVVAVAYRLARGETALEESTPEEPLVYLHGEGQIAKALEEAFADREVGATFEASVSPVGWVEPSSASGLRLLPRDALPAELEPAEGAEVKLAEGEETFSVWITEVADHHVQVSLTPPWGDAQLTLQGEILKVRPATADELEAGEAITLEPAAKPAKKKAKSEQE